MINTLFILCGYLIGSISSAVIVCRIMGLPDPREQGSGNPGATNVLRIGGKKAAALTLAADVLKGLLPVLIALFSGAASIVVALCGLSAFLGHLYPIFFQFRGGKGVATAFGALLGISAPTAVTLLLIWLLVARVFKKSSLAAILTAIVAPLVLWVAAAPIDTIAVVLVLIALLIYRHKSNIERLLSGRETNIGR